VIDPALTGAKASQQTAMAGSHGQDTAGAALLRERRRQGLSLGDISRQLKLSVRQVEALERDDYSGYKSTVFIHGFIRNYAKLLGLDPDPLVRATDLMLNPPATQEALPREPEPSRPLGKEKWNLKLLPTASVIGVAAIVAMVYFGGRSAPDADGVAVPVAPHDKPVTATKNAPDAEAGLEKKPRAKSKVSVDSAEVKPVTGPDATPEARTEITSKTGTDDGVPAEAIETSAADPSGLVTVRMIFDEESWVEIKDRAGNTIFGQLNPAGSRRKVSGEPPLSVVIGNAAGVRLFAGDKNIDLAPHTHVDVARFTLE
jgi:cytoskeleton protein RodZ